MDVRRRVTAIALGASLGGLLFGADTSTMNGAVTGLETAFGLESGSTGLVVAISLLGCALGATCASRVAHPLGQRNTMCLGGLLVVVGAVGAALSVGTPMLIVFRIVSGTGIGLLSVVVPGYITEIAPPAIRGRLSSLWQLSIVIGICGGLVVDYLLRRAAGGEVEPLLWGGASWRWMFGALALVAVAQVLVASRLPDSEHHRQRASDSGTARLSVLRGRAFGLVPIVWVGIAMAALQQFVGINVIFFYSTTLWQSVGFSPDDSFQTGIVTDVVNIAATIVAIGLVDRVGRRPLLLVGSGGIAVTLAVMAFCFSKIDADGLLPGGYGPVALVAANLFVVFFGVSWGPLMWVVLGELFDTRVRTAALSLTVAVNWLANFAVTQTFPTLSDVSLSFAYLLYAVFGVLALLFVARFVPETKGKVLG
ncbi:MFS transporter [Rhodococcus sp. HNM0569]|uniref:MFS transporter n=1 Tax=Rhodococcus sp. HNM0569 TaxID=2716340 RepID=UPI00146E9F3E|nr:MFS transporter [Rhodococcus sp. HNM0569]NLU82341.1 sugar porter family MFS transporter [Rhodococcus sp. HNM0569]